MPSAFHNHSLDVGAPALLDHLGEEVTYTPVIGASRVIVAVVDRDPPAVTSPGGVRGRPVPSITITVKNNAEDGVSSSTIDLGGDKITVSRRVGEIAQARGIDTIVSQDGGMLILELK